MGPTTQGPPAPLRLGLERTWDSPLLKVRGTSSWRPWGLSGAARMPGCRVASAGVGLASTKGVA